MARVSGQVDDAEDTASYQSPTPVVGSPMYDDRTLDMHSNQAIRLWYQHFTTLAARNRELASQVPSPNAFLSTPDADMLNLPRPSTVAGKKLRPTSGGADALLSAPSSSAGAAAVMDVEAQQRQKRQRDEWVNYFQNALDRDGGMEHALSKVIRHWSNASSRVGGSGVVDFRPPGARGGRPRGAWKKVPGRLRRMPRPVS